MSSSIWSLQQQKLYPTFNTSWNVTLD